MLSGEIILKRDLGAFPAPPTLAARSTWHPFLEVTIQLAAAVQIGNAHESDVKALLKTALRHFRLLHAQEPTADEVSAEAVENQRDHSLIQAERMYSELLYCTSIIRVGKGGPT